MVTMRADLEAVLAPLEHARPLPPQVYLDPEILALEARAIFAQSWRCIGLAQDVELPGEWIRQANSRLIAIRGEDLQLRAMFDVCVHRGSTLLEGERGRTGKLECPYHGWSYDLAGRSKSHLPAFRDTRLPSVQVMVRGPLVLASESAPSLAALVLLDELSIVRRVHHDRWETAANWKLLGENFLESHHFPRVHPRLEALTPHARSGSRNDEGPWLEGTMELTRDTVSTDGETHGRPRIGPPRVHDAMLFPTTFLSLQPDYLLVYRLAPIAVDRTLVDFDILAHPSVTSAADVVDLWKTINAEDRAICERQQIGIASGHWSPRGYDPSEDGTHAFDRKIASALLESGK